MGELIYGEESGRILGACYAVYKDKGPGFLEPVYQECLEIEFTDRSITFVPQSPLGLSYKGHTLKQHYFPDFICENKILVEIKAVANIVAEHEAQVINYLRATGFKLGLLVNFGHFPELQVKRLVL